MKYKVESLDKGSELQYFGLEFIIIEDPCDDFSDPLGFFYDEKTANRVCGLLNQDLEKTPCPRPSY